eukprot:4768926-Pyramimonas_sp.AAC.1
MAPAGPKFQMIMKQSSGRLCIRTISRVKPKGPQFSPGGTTCTKQQTSFTGINRKIVSTYEPKEWLLTNSPVTPTKRITKTTLLDTTTTRILVMGIIA